MKPENQSTPRSDKKIVRIDLKKHGQSAVFSGRKRGSAVRDSYPELDDFQSNIEIIVPENVFTISSSFFLGLLGLNIRNLGERVFRSKLSIKGRYSKRFLDSAIDQASDKLVPLD